MDDVTATTRSDTQPRLDLQEHLADLEARGLVTRIDHPVNKDTELHPLVRLQFIGGIPETQGLPLYQCGGWKRPQIRHAGGGGLDCRIGGNLFARHARQGRGYR
jgi:hypothetical protein